MIQGTDPIRVGLLGRSAVSLPLVRADGEPFQISVEHTEIKLKISLHPDLAPIATLLRSTGDILVANGGQGILYVEFTPAAIALLNNYRLFHGLVEVYDIDETTLVFAGAYTLLPSNKYITEAYPVSALLSTRFMNTLGLLGDDGGAGYLDGIATVDQPVGCQISYVLNGEEQKRILEVKTDQAGAGFTNPLDFNAGSNNKVWRAF